LVLFPPFDCFFSSFACWWTKTGTMPPTQSTRFCFSPFFPRDFQNSTACLVGGAKSFKHSIYSPKPLHPPKKRPRKRLLFSVESLCSSPQAPFPWNFFPDLLFTDDFSPQSLDWSFLINSQEHSDIFLIALFHCAFSCV